MRDTEKPGDPAEVLQDAATFSATPHSPNPGGCGPPGACGEGTATEPRAEDWPESEELGQAEVSAQEMAAYGTTVRRIEWVIGVAGAVGAAAVAWPLGW